MSCYFRHLKELFAGTGIRVTPENKKRIDAAIHEIVRVKYKNCPDAWKKIKVELASDTSRKAFVKKLGTIGL
jgi:hypothetical protein